MKTLLIGPPVQGAAAGAPPKGGVPKGQPRGPDFEHTFERALDRAGGLRFSAHAASRLASRRITLSDGQVERIRGAVNEAAARGAKDSLVVAGELALVVNVPSRTVITAMERGDTGAKVFTNIDSAVIL